MSTTQVIVNFHTVDWRNTDSILVYLVGSLLGHNMKYVHVSLTVISGDHSYNIDYSRWGLQLPANDELKNVAQRVPLDDTQGVLLDLITGRLITALTMRLKLSISDLILSGLRIEPAGFTCTTFAKYLLGLTDHKKPITPLDLYRLLSDTPWSLQTQNNLYGMRRAQNAAAEITGQYSTMKD